MTIEDYNSEAYKAGVRAGEAYNSEPTVEVYEGLPNPYEYGTEDWQLWNLGWNYTAAMQTPTVE